MGLGETLALLILLPPAIWAGLAFIGRMLLNQLAARDLERYKHQLRHETKINLAASLV